MSFFDFLDSSIFKPAGKGLSEADTFMKREMPFDLGWGAPAAAVGAYFGAPYAMEALGSTGSAGGQGMLSSLGGDGGSFGGDLFQLNGSNDVFGGFSPTGSSASGMGSGLGTSSSNPMAYNDPYAAQDVMQQARDTNVPSNSSTSWDRGSNTGSSAGSNASSNKNYNSQLTQQLLGNLLKSQQGVSQQNQGVYQNNTKPMDVARQSAFLPTPSMVQVQDKQTDLAALIKALRG